MATAGHAMHRDVFLDELLRGEALTRELDACLDGPVPADHYRSLVHGILASWERLVCMTGAVKLEDEHAVLSCDDGGGTPPRKALHPASKKRKVLETRTSKVRVSEAVGTDGDDGHSWRKYGQKKILGAQNPRAYYRCTHRFTQSCEALKMVQRSDEDPSLLDVTYRGEHTCSSRRRAAAALLQTFKAELRVKTEDLHDAAPEPTPTTVESEVTSGGLSPFAGPATPESALLAATWEATAGGVFAGESPVDGDLDWEWETMFRFDEPMPNLDSVLAG